MHFGLDRLQPLGRALMLPIAVLPVAGLLLRLGQPDMLDIAFIAAAGDAIFANLGLLFAIGVATGLARENHGAAGLAGAVAYLVTVEGAKALLTVPPEIAAELVGVWRSAQLAKLSVPAGILAGVAAGWLYNCTATIKLPEYLAFFGGRRFVPIAAGLYGIVAALVFGLGFPVLASGIAMLSQWVVGAGSVGLFLYGALNRLLLITGLHHILNNLAWFIIGDFHGATGDLKRFFAGDPSAGSFMSGFFPVMMFGLPAACLAMYRSALPARRKAVGGLLLSLAATSFLTGVTEPIEFTFMFLAPLLYAVHAVLTGISMVVMDALGVKLGFGFSAGLFDYLLNFGLATRPLWLLPVGAVYFAVYYFAFRFCIERFDLKTPGRETEPLPVGSGATNDRARRYVAALGGAANLGSVDACTTRLRLILADTAQADEAALRALGARGVVRVGDHGFQVVVGPSADLLCSEIKATLATSGDARPMLTGHLGGKQNIRSVEVRGSRLRILVDDPRAVQIAALVGAGGRGVVECQGNVLHLIVGPDAEAWLDRIEQPSDHGQRQ